MLIVGLSALVSLGLIVGLVAGIAVMLRERLPQVKAALSGIEALMPPSTPPAETNLVLVPVRARANATKRAA